MKTITLSERIRLAHCNEHGAGVVFLLDYSGEVEKLESYETQAEFKLAYKNLRARETTQDELAKALVMA